MTTLTPQTLPPSEDIDSWLEILATAGVIPRQLGLVNLAEDAEVIQKDLWIDGSN